MTGQVLDRAVALVALVLLAPLLLVIALAVKLSSRGPAIFRQVRVGRDGRPVEILKFRTMVQGSDRGSDNITPSGDPRVTPLGRYLRAWYLDELPQLYNVLRGDMSLVGPRPETPEYVALYTPAERQVLAVRPGIAGPSTLAHMDEAERLAEADDPADHYRNVVLHQRVEMDLGYLEMKSVGYDLRLLLRQVVAIARQ